jgi:hypothetical protein
MSVPKNARLTPHGSERIVRRVESGQTPKRLPADRSQMDFPISQREVGWIARSQFAAHRRYRRTPQVVVAEVEHLRRQRHTGQRITARFVADLSNRRLTA